MIHDAPETSAVVDSSDEAAELIKRLIVKSAELERERDALAGKFTKLDKPKYSGEPMLDAVLGTPNPDFRAWVDSLPPTYWARYDLSAARIGWEAASNHIFENVKDVATDPAPVKPDKT